MLIWLSCSFKRYIRMITLDEMNENQSNHINNYTEKIFKYLMEQGFKLWKKQKLFKIKTPLNTSAHMS